MNLKSRMYPIRWYGATPEVILCLRVVYGTLPSLDLVRLSNTYLLKSNPYLLPITFLYLTAASEVDPLPEV